MGAVRGYNLMSGSESGASNYEAMLTTHLITRKYNDHSRSPTPPRQLSRREQAEARLVSEREARGLADDAPANPQAPWRIAASIPQPRAAP